MIALFLTALSLTLQNIGDKIWMNECGGKVEGLVHFGKGEGFVSLGIGHFIWYAEGKKERFQETFPDFVKYAAADGVQAPEWMRGASPWKSAEEVDAARSAEMRKWLIATKDLQVGFMAARLKEAAGSFPTKERKFVQALMCDERGLFALIDYANFKGTGISEEERYQGQGWGLLQVLGKMREGSVEEFVRAAKDVLRMRVALASRNEEQWLKGWLKRVDGYLKY